MSVSALAGDGFRNRGEAQTRLEAFVDASFAFALTLLVISYNDLPRNSDDLILALKGIPAYAASFSMIAMFWIGHNTWCRRFGLDDRFSTIVSLCLVFLILIFVFPLRAQFGSLFAWVSGGWLPSDYQIRSAFDLSIMFATFGGSFAALSLCFVLLYAHALRHKDQLQLAPCELELTRLARNQWLCRIFIGLLSLLLALTTPRDPGMFRATLPGLSLFLLNVAQVVFKRLHWRVVARSATSSTQGT